MKPTGLRASLSGRLSSNVCLLGHVNLLAPSPRYRGTGCPVRSTSPQPPVAQHKCRALPRRQGAVLKAVQTETDPWTANGHDVQSPFHIAYPPYAGVTSIWQANADRFGDQLAVSDPHKPKAVELTYRQLKDLIEQFAAGLQDLGLGRGDKVSLFAENSYRWIVADQGAMLNGAADAVRGSSVPADELSYILTQSGSCGLVVQDADTLKGLLPLLPPETAAALLFVVVLWPEGDGGGAGVAGAAGLPACPVLSFEEVLCRGQRRMASGGWRPAGVAADDLATLVYTSGTTGHPKAVALSHSNLMYQVSNFNYFLPVSPGESALSLLPPWHIYQRTVAYYLFSSGAKQVITNIRKFKDDLTAYPPDHFVCVPLVLDTLYNKVMAKLRSGSAVARTVALTLINAAMAFVCARRTLQGVDLRYALTPPRPLVLLRAAALCVVLWPLFAAARALVARKVRAALGVRRTFVSGGGSLAPHIDDFYEALGVEVLNGWGLTETSPVLACRRAAPRANVRGGVGVPVPGTALRVVDPDSLADVAPGQRGLILARGPGVMRGYYGDEEATARAFRAGGGWLDTGDLGWIAPSSVAGSHMGGQVVLTGRAKDTIVLLSGKNVEPQPIEDAAACSPLLRHALLVGQDKRELGALIFPDTEQLDALALNRGCSSWQELPTGEVESLLHEEVNRHNSARADYHHEDHVAHVAVLHAALSVDDGTLTRTMKPRRPAILQRYEGEVAALMHRLRG